MQYKFLTLAAMVATATAGVPHLAARQTGDSSACISALQGLITDFPAIPDSLVTATDISIGTATDSCAVSYPSSLSSAVSSYASQVASWYSKNMDKVSSLTSACPAVGDNGFGAEFQCASSFLAQQTASVSTTTTMTGSTSATATSSSGGSSAATTTSSKGGAARETGAMMAVAAAAGFAMMAL